MSEKSIEEVEISADESLVEPPSAPKLFVTGGAILGALLASSCCVLPLAFLLLGISGAWIANVSALAPYQPIFLVLTLGFLGTGFYWVYFKSKTDCADGTFCATPASDRIVKTGLWLATFLVLLALAFPYVAPLIFDV